MTAAPKLQPVADMTELLKTFTLLKGADDGALSFVSQNIETVKYAKGEPIILENEVSDHVYFVHVGAVEIISYVSQEKRVQRLALLKPGMHFADFSILSGTTKSGSAYAYVDCILFRMPAGKYLEMLRKFPIVARTSAQHLADMTMRTETLNEFIPVYQAQDLKLERQVADMLPKHIWKKFGIVPLGLKSGSLSVAMIDPHNDEFHRFLQPVLPSASIVAYLVSDMSFESVMDHAINWLKAPQSQHQPAKANPGFADVAALVKGAPLLAELPEAIQQQLSGFLQPHQVKAGQALLTPGSQLEGIVVIMKGQLQVTHPIASSKCVAHVANLGPGEIFGETNVLTGKPNLHHVKALDDTAYVFLPKALVDQLMTSPLFTIPLARGFIHRLQAIGHNSGIRYFKEYEALNFQPVLHFLPHSLIAEEKMIPFKIVDGEVTVGMVRLDTSRVVGAIGRYLADYRVRILAITENQFRSYHQQFKVLAEQEGSNTKGGVKFTQADPIKVLNDVLTEGMHNRASDIHFEPFERHFSVRYRIDGVMVEREQKIPPEMTKEIIGRLKVLASMDI
ncbi:MAG: ATPase, T2SS/T4P/T4SS family, partial [Bdellovibrionia bacterium]